MGSDGITDVWYFCYHLTGPRRLGTMAASPLLGYNTNVRHLGNLYHIQTEDSGASHGHIFTHLFADGGRVIASKKTTYSQYVDTAGFPDVVKRLMRESHKAMFIALRDGTFDEDEAAGARAIAAREITLDSEALSEPLPSAPPVADGIGSPPPLDIDELERAAAAHIAEAEAAQVPRASAPRYATTRPTTAAARSGVPTRPNPGSESIFGGGLLSEKSLDEVILSYLAEDIEEG